MLAVRAGAHALDTRQRAAPVRAARVCFLIDELAHAGTESQLLALIKNLDRRRVEPVLCLLRGDNPVSQTLEPADCRVERLHVGSLRSPRTWLKAWRFARWLRRERFDVVQTYFPDSTYFGLPAARWAGVPHRLRTRNNLGHWLTPTHRLMQRLLRGSVTATVTNCAAARRALIEAEGTHPETVVVLENGVDLEPFLSLRQASIGPGRPRTVGVVANLRAVKGIDVFLDAAASLVGTFADLTFKIAGEGAEQDRLKSQARRLGIGERCQFVGSVRNIGGFLEALDLAVLPSRAEGMSNALLEYMAAARPIVATNVGAASELIDDGIHGLLVPPENAAALANGMARQLREPDEARRMGIAARERARQRYSRAAMVRRFEDFYQGLIRGA